MALTQDQLRQALGGPSFGQGGAFEGAPSSGAYNGVVPVDSSIPQFTTDNNGNQQLNPDFVNAYWGQLPSVKVGDREFAPENIVPVDDKTLMYNPNAVVDSPYGKVTPTINIKPHDMSTLDKIGDFVGNIAPGLLLAPLTAGLGVGGIVAQVAGNALLSGSLNPIDIAGGIAKVLGVDPTIVSAATTAGNVAAGGKLNLDIGGTDPASTHGGPDTSTPENNASTPSGSGPDSTTTSPPGSNATIQASDIPVMLAGQGAPSVTGRSAALPSPGGGSALPGAGGVSALPTKGIVNSALGG